MTTIDPLTATPLPTLLAAIENALTTGSHMTKANLAFDVLCEQLGVDRDRLHFDAGWPDPAKTFHHKTETYGLLVDGVVRIAGITCMGDAVVAAWDHDGSTIVSRTVVHYRDGHAEDGGWQPTGKDRA